MRATGARRGCAGRTGSTTTAASWTVYASDCRMPRLDRTSSSAFPARPMRTSIGSVDYLESSPLTSLHVFPYPDRPGTEASALRREGARARWSRSAGACVRDIGESAGRAIPRSAGRYATARADDRRRIGRHHRQRTPRPNRAGPPAERANPRVRGFLTPPRRLHVAARQFSRISRGRHRCAHELRHSNAGQVSQIRYLP